MLRHAHAGEMRIAQALLGIGFLALIIFELRSGIAGAKFGAVSASGHPGTFAFFIAIQAFLAAVFLSGSMGISLKRVARRALIVIGILFAWTILEVTRDMLKLGAGMSPEELLVYGVLGLVVIAVMITLGYQFIWLEIRDRSRK